MTRARILIVSLFIATASFAQKPQLTLPPDTILEPEVFELDSLLETIDEIASDSVNLLNESLYKGSWNSTQIKYSLSSLPGIKDTVTINLIGPNDHAYFHPVKGKVISKYGWRHGRMHTGTDVKLHLNDSVRCAFDGRVRMAKKSRGYGNLVLVRHNNGLETIYAHLNCIKVRVNDSIKAGDLIGLGGRTGRATTEHLHFETRLLGEPFDSNKYIDFETFALRTDKIYYNNKRFEIDRNEFKKKLAPEAAPTLASKTSKTGGKKHVIRKGDNLSTIARKYHTSVKKICAVNKISPKKTLKIGSTLRIN